VQRRRERRCTSWSGNGARRSWVVAGVEGLGFRSGRGGEGAATVEAAAAAASWRARAAASLRLRWIGNLDYLKNKSTDQNCLRGRRKKKEIKDRSSEVLVSSGKMTGCDDPWRHGAFHHRFDRVWGERGSNSRPQDHSKL
jgi:hypothetical protein